MSLKFHFCVITKFKSFQNCVILYLNFEKNVSSQNTFFFKIVSLYDMNYRYFITLFSINPTKIIKKYKINN